MEKSLTKKDLDNATIVAKKRLAAFKKASDPLRKYLCNNYHPHITAIITGTSIELVEGICVMSKNFEFIKD